MRPFTLEEFLKMKLTDRESMRRASKAIDDFRKKYGKTDKSFNSVEAIRKMREPHR